jgi:hypothetical protein
MPRMITGLRAFAAGDEPERPDAEHGNERT